MASNLLNGKKPRHGEADCTAIGASSSRSSRFFGRAAVIGVPRLPAGAVEPVRAGAQPFEQVPLQGLVERAVDEVVALGGADLLGRRIQVTARGETAAHGLGPPGQFGLDEIR
ncbi:hypothetical protein J2Z21_008090 [Streptomyces griseochromogenes]|uniref:Uncharacterized protein n=1 Tax=Streptomyces griseochromogenes TaxID=68214 RepID=A0ABS4M5W8_9ACTN|nr:hypothetical protein [Streptomyces griseochromogenes]MBP2055077.1 hypothetical protein [Streptomyces griseochromogenes]